MENKQEINKLNDLLKAIKIGMLTTLQDNGELHARPMAKLEDEFNGTFRFFTSLNSPKVYEVKEDSQVNITFSEPSDSTYVSCKGISRINKDKELINSLWNPMCKVWFPKGVEDPDLVVLEVSVTEAEYWDGPSSAFIRLLGFTKALITGDKSSIGENRKISI